MYISKAMLSSSANTIHTCIVFAEDESIAFEMYIHQKNCCDDVASTRSESGRRTANGHLDEVAVRDVLDLLHAQYAIITGGKSKDGCPIITFPDNANFHNLNDFEYQRLMLYLTSVPSLQDADTGFHLIIDRRKDRWNAVKAVLLKISEFFPGMIQIAYVIRPASFLQKAISEVSNKLFKEEFKFRVVVCDRMDELFSYLDQSQVTEELGGTLVYSHQDWIQQRIELQKFSTMTKEVSQALDVFLSNIHETEFPNTVEATKQLLEHQGLQYSELKDEISSTAKHGENLLQNIKKNPASKCIDPASNENNYISDKLGNVFAVERLLVQLDENEKTFDEYWRQHSVKLEQCLEIRRFEQSFKELQSNFDVHLKKISEMTEIGETIIIVDALIHEAVTFQSECLSDIEKAEELISSGQRLTNIRNSRSLDCIEPKCTELSRMCEMLNDKLAGRLDTLQKCKDLMERIEQMESVNRIEDGHREIDKGGGEITTETKDSLGSEEVRCARRGHTLAELLTTERIYVEELGSIIKGYKEELLSDVMLPDVPQCLLDKMDVLFGNIDELYSFHANTFLRDLENCIPSTDLVALCFVQWRDTFFRLYSYYCQNIPRSEQVREALMDCNQCLIECQRKLGHKLPLAAYLLKPVQRITKYQLLLKDLLRYSDDPVCVQQLQEALDCMLVVLKCVNDSMHQIAITDLPIDLSHQGDLLLQGSFSVWTESKKDLRLRLKTMQRHIFLYQKAIIFCKIAATKSIHNKATYHFKNYLKMSQIGLTESVKGDEKKFEIWLQGRQEVHTIQAATIEQKQTWVKEIKRVLFNQLEELKGEKIKQYSALNHNPSIIQP